MPKKPEPPRELRISTTLSLPLKAVTETLGIVATKGKGKTYLLTVLAEEILGTGVQLVLLDVVGVCWGLRSNAAGDGDGYPILILGGEHADAPLDPKSGAAVADFLIETRQSAVLDLSEMSGAEMSRFARDLAERLYHKNPRRPLHLMCDEVDQFAPQKPIGPEALTLGAFDKLVRRGRAKGIGFSFATQRPAVVHKNILTQVSALVMMGLGAPQDLAAVDAWLAGNASEAERREAIASLPLLEQGEAYVYSPGWLGELQRIRVRTKRTYDSSRTPEVGEELLLPSAQAAVDLGALAERFGALMETAEEDAPEKLQARIRELEQQVRAKTGQAAVPEAEVAARISAAVDEATKELLAHNRQLKHLMDEVQEGLRNALKHAELAAYVQTEEPAADDGDWLDTVPPVATPDPAPRAKRPKPKAPPEAGDGEEVDPLEGMGRPILRTVAALQSRGVEHPKLRHVGAILDRSSESGHFRAKVRALVAAGRATVAYGRISTAEIILPPHELPSLADVHRMWIDRTGGIKGEILSAALSAYPGSVPLRTIAERLDKSSESGHFRKQVRELVRSGLVTTSAGKVTATDALFPEGLK